MTHAIDRCRELALRWSEGEASDAERWEAAGCETCRSHLLDYVQLAAQLSGLGDAVVESLVHLVPGALEVETLTHHPNLVLRLRLRPGPSHAEVRDAVRDVMSPLSEAGVEWWVVAGGLVIRPAAFEEATGKLATTVTAKENAEHDLEAARAECDRLRVELSEEKERVEAMKAEVWEANEDSFKCGKIAAEAGCLVANAPSDAVRTLANRYMEVRAERDRLRAAIETAGNDRLRSEMQLGVVRDRLRALLATEPAVSEERCGEIQRQCTPRRRRSREELVKLIGENAADNYLSFPDESSDEARDAALEAVHPLLAAARQLHALRAGMREIVGGEATSAPTRAALDARQLFDLQRMREDYRVALEEGFGATDRSVRVVSVHECFRCGGGHHVPIRPLTRRVAPAESGEWTHWATCPTNGEPILIRGVD